MSIVNYRTLSELVTARAEQTLASYGEFIGTLSEVEQRWVATLAKTAALEGANAAYDWIEGKESP